jgi:hypothetical protein
LILSSARFFEREIIHKTRDFVNGKIMFNVRTPFVTAALP